jgi:hypothetical protein
MAVDRLLVAHLSRFQPRPLLAALVQHFGCPATTPRFYDPATLPMQRIGHQTAGILGEVAPFRHDRAAFAPLAFEPHTLREGPQFFRLPLATTHADFAKTLGMQLP